MGSDILIACLCLYLPGQNKFKPATFYCRVRRFEPLDENRGIRSTASDPDLSPRRSPPERPYRDCHGNKHPYSEQPSRPRPRRPSEKRDRVGDHRVCNEETDQRGAADQQASIAPALGVGLGRIREGPRPVTRYACGTDCRKHIARLPVGADGLTSLVALR